MPAVHANTRLIWDLPLRLFHWLLVICVAGSWLTHKIGIGAFAWHQRFGYATLVLVFFRIVWGFVGPRHARFASFVRGAPTVLGYVRTLFTARYRHYAGHNPLGALMVIAFLLLLGCQALAGLFANDEIMLAGPLYGHVTDATSDRLTSLHRQLSEVLWIAIGLHIAAVALHWLLKRDNLVGPMLTGRKRGAWLTDQDEIRSSRILLALAITACGAAVLYWVLATAPEPSLLLF